MSEWTPQVGEKVKRLTARAWGPRRGEWFKEETVVVKKVTKAGFIHARGDKFQKRQDGQWWRWLPKAQRSDYWVKIEKL